MKRLLGIIACAALLTLCMAANAESIDIPWTIEYQSENGELFTEIPAYTTKVGRSSKQLDVTMPSSITRGEALTVSINNPDGFDFGNPVFVQRNGEMIGWSDQINAANNYTVTLPAYYFDVGEYSISLTVTDTETSERVSANKNLTVTGTNGAEGPTITASKTTADINEQITFTISMPGAEKFVSRTVTFVDGSGRSFSYSDLRESANQSERIDSSRYSGSTLVCFARAYINGAWTAESRCDVTINEAPKLDAPMITAPSDVEIGKSFEITISPVDHAEKYSVVITKNGRWIYDQECTEAGTYTLPALDDPGEYELRVRAMATGYEDSDTVWKDINAAGELIEGPVVTSDKAEYEVKENAVFTAVKEGAEQFRFKLQSYNEDGSMNMSFAETVVNAVDGAAQYERRIGSEFDANTIEMRVRALVNSIWTAETTVTVKVKKAARLNTPVVSVPNSPHEAGTPVHINIVEVEGAAYYTVYASSISDYRIYYSYHFEEAGENELTGLADPDTYTIEVTAHPDYNNKEVIESLPAKANLTLTGTLANGPEAWSDNASIPIGSGIHFFAQLEGAEKFSWIGSLLYPDGSNWMSSYDSGCANANDGQTEYDTRISDNSRYIDKIYVAKIRAMVNGKWTAASEVRVTITDKEKPAMLAVDFDLPKALKRIEDSSFAGIKSKAVYVHDSCTFIGEYAFANSSVQQIRIPKDCSFQSNAFDGCNLTLIIAPEGGIAEQLVRTYCANHPNCQYYWEH